MASVRTTLGGRLTCRKRMDSIVTGAVMGERREKTLQGLAGWPEGLESWDYQLV
jgi:hypothetical protein